ncbi:lipopolysaccharide heptosyltransferase I [Cupriavidus sp. IDO]|uniref:lipopolysaccharide heptosyltransferase I n=1 Tax=Cupriavidus sp. IDO TaxID=1539142 RepID=UPI0005790FB2|nr:lipopolysaccharide heptosyltransferase I [Cupriavidus sp. IDO]KWR89704.1 ADP-heptose--LPS heptosyltransferase [Cupriavidus sp. IDO]
MKRILIVKLTSLGDMVFTQPLVADLQRAFPGVKIDWIADSYCADVPRWNPNIDRVIAAPLRAVKKSRKWSDLRAIFGALRELRREKYDAVLDVHGVYKSAIVSFLARTRHRYGYPVGELGESGARFAYNHIFAPYIDADCARQRMRRAVSRAFGFELTKEMDYGLEMPPNTPALADKGPYAMLFHATSSEEKKWPVADWISVGSAISARGLRVLVPWGNDAERSEAETIAASVPGAEVMPRLSITGVAQMVGKASLVVGMDTGFVHIADALRRPTIILFTQTSRHLYGVNAPGRAVSLGGGGVVPERAEVLAAIDEVLGVQPPVASQH